MILEHTFAICAYKESPYLEECIQSLKKQTVPSRIYIATSTPCDYINQIAEKYNLLVYVNQGTSGITQDWNFAYRIADTPVVTIAHQDDVYEKEYTENIIRYRRNAKKPLILFTDYRELREGQYVETNRLLKVKRLMLFPLRLPLFWKNRWVRRRILSMGSPICCPSVAIVKENIAETEVFQNHFRSNCDWEAWERLSKRKGSFVYINRRLMAHRIHEESETSHIIQGNQRQKEDVEMFRKFWPEKIAVLIEKFYQKSEDSNSSHS